MFKKDNQNVYANIKEREFRMNSMDYIRRAMWYFENENGDISKLKEYRDQLKKMTMEAATTDMEMHRYFLDMAIIVMLIDNKITELERGS